ncbi:DNA-directed RNA polymerase subunit omega [Candidatus Aquarickettsia rohweri]|uniref:DNA-directed RNA polymerase subunit omega n=1 Tax=Candidatus Aquarickettsia rohweri TaxID=2602574 RepID=A0A3S0FN52_9RICK|nr:DNA-directed RNA polymerase subunit omega [Candidatus Aquarickettsia rohweri]MSO13282.1 DNA-directed RNA polymerase subunit omega [Rickettsiales endosymbiont of Trichoplax sp. H2]RST65819.1 DNA-directed RNA polymerase subunit omega [Candidatus Aquarickettsia rohweri]
MARITIEDCNKFVENRFELVLVAAQRGKELNHGAQIKIDNVKKDKEAIVALREIAAGVLDIENLKSSLVKKTFIDNQEDILLKKQENTLDDINQEILDEIDSLKDSSNIESENQLFQNEEDIKE